jgi:DNA (cytosine-5)-methyltransferase 1
LSNSMLKVLDLFSGIGGFSLGLERTGGFETVAFCEIEEYPRHILAKHWPGVPCFEDVTTAEFEPIGTVDLVTAGFPCQDISTAGKRAGLTGSNSSLFWFVLRTLCMVGRPRVLLENVAALLDRGMGSVLGALATFGYDAEWHCIPASAIGAPHRRDRVWIVADAQRDEQPRQEPCVGPFGRMGRIEQSVAWDGGWQAALSALRGMDDGLSRSVDRTDTLRNSVVPQVVTLIGQELAA